MEPFSGFLGTFVPLKKREVPEVSIDKTYFYYLKDKNGQPVVTICLLNEKDTKNYARGISICSLSETFE